MLGRETRMAAVIILSSLLHSPHKPSHLFFSSSSTCKKLSLNLSISPNFSKIFVFFLSVIFLSVLKSMSESSSVYQFNRKKLFSFFFILYLYLVRRMGLMLLYAISRQLLTAWPIDLLYKLSGSIHIGEIVGGRIDRW